MVQPAGDRRFDAVRGLPCQSGEARLDTFTPFGKAAHHDNGDAKARRFFLDATGIADDECGTLDERETREVVDRIDDAQVGHVAEDVRYRLAYVRVEVGREDPIEVRVVGGQSFEQMADACKHSTKIFTAMAGDQHQRPRGGGLYYVGQHR